MVGSPKPVEPDLAPLDLETPAATATPAPEAAEVEVPVLAAPRDGVPEVVDTVSALSATAAALASGSGAIAVDAERAQGFRYSARAYLLQFRRADSGTHLVDPIAFDSDDLGELRDALAGSTWVIHAASQDLPCLAELGLVPDRLFDTELAGRLLGLPKVNLGALVEQYFGVRLLKEHSAANWSNRPMPTEWLSYAALDVELLTELAERLREELDEAGKLEWAYQEFEALRTADWSTRIDPERWRRTSGLHSVHSRLALGVVRELWRTRDQLAQELDTAPGRVLHDQAITELAARANGMRPQVPSLSDLRAVEGFRRRHARRWENNWAQALDRVRATSASDLPPPHATHDGPPPIRSWQNRDPAAWARWNRVRPAVNDRADSLSLAPENLLTPDSLRRIVWQPPQPLDEESVDAMLAELGARPWQRAQLTSLLVTLLADPA